jgi:hypothetical protein
VARGKDHHIQPRRLSAIGGGDDRVSHPVGIQDTDTEAAGLEVGALDWLDIEDRAVVLGNVKSPEVNLGKRLIKLIQLAGAERARTPATGDLPARQSLLTSNRPVEDWGKLLGDVAAVAAMLDRLLHHGNVLKCGPRSRRTKVAATGVGSYAATVVVTNPS